MAWLVAGAGIWYLLDQAYTSVYDNTIKPVSEWMDQREKERQEQERLEREKEKKEEREALLKKHNEIRERYGLPTRAVYGQRKEDKVDLECWSPWG